MDALNALLEGYKKNHPEFQPGDTIKVHLLVKEREKERIQVFEGVVIGVKGSGVSRTFTVRKISDGVAVERIFPMHSPFIKKIQKVRRGQVRRAKLYFLRGKKGKAARLKESWTPPSVEAPASSPEPGTKAPASEDTTSGS